MAVLVTVGCSSQGPGVGSDRPTPAPAAYVVRSGDTLFGIARRFGLDHRDIARWNQLGDGTRIYPGQQLRLRVAGVATGAMRPGPSAVADDPAEAPLAWHWPTRGEVVLGFGQSAKTASGVLIAGSEGQPVVAAADGEVVYSGSGLTGYGQLVIIRHSAAWLSAYGHNKELMVREGERVRAGQQIASMGEAGGRRAALHFEVRRNGEPVDPLRYLPTPPS